ncbi:DNA/RNA non-specific endonuclease [Thiomicrorhabdus hydrogeniphila]
MIKRARKTIKTILLSGVILSSSLSAANASGYECDTIVKKQGYQACYNYGLKGTLFTKHHMTAADLKKEGLSRKGIRFYEETSIPKKYRATLADYRGSGFDRSHLVSNDDMNHDARLQKETFSLVCQSPHYPNVNRGSLLKVEKAIRRLTIRHGESTVYSGNVFDTINPKRMGVGRVAIPKAVFKIALFPDGKNIAFLIPNVKEKQGNRLKDFVVPIAQINKLTGFDFRK